MICSLGFSNGWAVSRLGAQQHPLDVLGQAIAILDTHWRALWGNADWVYG
ncbi:MAG: hypothetical protein HC838_16865 [Spirulinaceae cyanobacterium RM2_2_10]|nr:hypothetical protein [Spirulinaceae cyanobacterium RM2_2_10]